MNKNTVRSLIEGQFTDLSELIESSPSCLKLINSEGLLLNMNATGLCLIEAEGLDEIYRANVYDIVEESHRDKFIAFNGHVCSGRKGTLVFEIVGLKGTRRWMETYAAPFKMANGEIAHIAITNDISERIKSEQEYARQEQALIEASRLSSLGQFAGGIAHEINNPLTVILAKTSLMLEKIENDEFDKDYMLSSLTKVKGTVSRISNIINNLRSFSRDPANDEMEWKNIHEIVSDTMSLCEEKFRQRSIGIEVIVPNNAELNCQEVAISQLMMNLLNNSFDALKSLRNKWIRIELITKGSVGQILFTDSGDGIAPEIKDRLMDPFFTTKDVGEGTGLGLSLSANVMQMHEGRIYLNDQADNTQFVLEFPIEKMRGI